LNLQASTVVFTLLATFAWIIIAYPYYVKNRDWWISSMFVSDTSLIKLVAYVALLGSAYASVKLGAWWDSIIVIVLGLLLALILTGVLRSFVQYVAVIGLVVCWVAGAYLLFHV